MKIVCMIPRLSYSGAPKMMAWVANQMAEKGHDVHIVTFYSEEQARILHENIKSHSLGVKQSSNRFIRNTTGMLKTIYKLHRTVSKIRPDIILSFLDSVGYTYLPFARIFSKAKLVVSERADPNTYKGINAKLRFFLMNFAHGYVFQTKGAQDFFIKQNSVYRHSTVIPNPVVLNENTLNIQKKIPSYENREKRIVTVGRLSIKQKRQDILLEAFKLFHEKNPEYRLVIYGGGQDWNKIQKMIEEKGLEKCAFLAGIITDVEEKIYNASAFVLTSDYEGIPNALIEAMSIGVPSISTDCSPGGAAMLIKDGQNGFIVPRGDVNAIAEKLTILATNKNISEKFSQSSVSVTHDFREKDIAGKWEAYFEEIIEKK